MTKIYTLVNVLGEWMVEPKPPTFTNDSLSSPLASFVIDPSSGVELTPTAESLQVSLNQSSPDSHSKKDTTPHCLWIAVSKKSIRVAVNFNGDRVSKVEMEDEELSEAFYLTRHGTCLGAVSSGIVDRPLRSENLGRHNEPRNGNRLLVAVLGIDHSRGLVLWASTVRFPKHRQEYEAHSRSRPIGKISMDDRSGDFLEHSSPIDINLRTLFHFRKPYPPRIDPCAVKKAVPYQPQPLSASYMAWIWGGGPLTGSQLDTIGMLLSLSVEWNVS